MVLWVHTEGCTMSKGRRSQATPLRCCRLLGILQEGGAVTSLQRFHCALLRSRRRAPGTAFFAALPLLRVYFEYKNRHLVGPSPAY